MNLQNILNQIEQVDPEVYDKLDTRRKAMKKFANASGKIALAALPLALGSMFNKAYGQTTTGAAGVLNFALTLEYLESEFYKAGVATAGLIPAGPGLTAITKIRDHEVAHVNFLKTAITAAGATPVSFTAASFDFTAKGTFPTVFSDYGVFLAVAQAFEDTGVRAYKGQAGNLQGTANRPYLTAALQIHSVEGRHAAHIRQMRRANGLLVPAGVVVKPYITLNQSGIGSPAVDGNYAGEELTTQAGVNIIGIGGNAYIDSKAASESFDEPLTMAQVQALVAPFFK